MTQRRQPQSCTFQRCLVGHESLLFQGHTGFVHLGGWSFQTPPSNPTVIPSALYVLGVQFQRPGSQRQACEGQTAGRGHAVGSAGQNGSWRGRP